VGPTFAAEWAKVFGVRNGEITSFRVVEDTARGGVPRLERNAMRWNRARFHFIAFAHTGGCVL